MYKINFNRPDVYRSIHKALRKAMFEFSYQTGKTNFEDPIAVQQLKAQFDELVNMLDMHGHKEDDICLPLLESKRIGITAHNENEHIRIHGVIEGLQQQMEELVKSPTANGFEKPWTFYYAVNEFISDYLMHMQLEEIEMTKLFYELCSDEEIAGMTEKIISSIPPQEMTVVAKHMLPALLPQDRIGMMTHVKQTAPPPAFQGMMMLCKSILTEAEYNQLEKALNTEKELVF